MKPKRAPTGRSACAAIVLAAGAATLFAPSLSYPWLAWDDRINVTQNPGLNPVTWASIFGFWLHPYEQLYIPVSYTFFALETIASRLLSGAAAGQPPSPVLFHACSIGLHASAGLLVWRLLDRIGLEDGAARFCAAMLFICHPLQVEAVAWISDQRGLLATVLSLLAIDRGLGAGDRSARRDLWRPPVSLGLFVLATLSKPQAVAMPLLLFVLDGRTWREPALRTALRAMPWTLAIVAVLAVTTGAQPATGVGQRAAVWLRPIVAGDALFHYASSLLAPTGLAIDYGRIPDVVLANPWAYVHAAVVAAGLIAVAGVPHLEGWRLPVTLAIMPLLPVLGFLPFAFQGISTVADRYAYLSMLGVALGFGRLASRSERLGRAGLVVVIACLLACCSLTYRQLLTWSSSTAVFARAIEINPRSYIAHRGLGGELLRQGKLAAALAAFDMSLALEKECRVPPRSHYERGRVLHRQGQLAAASRAYMLALTCDQDNVELRNDYGILLAQQGRIAEAAAQFEAAVAMQPQFIEAATNLSAARVLLGHSRAE